MTRRPRPPSPPPRPTVPELVAAPELAALALLDHALDLAVSAVVAEHMNLIDDLRRPGADGPLVERGRLVCARAASLRLVVARYVRAARAATRPSDPRDDPDTDLPF